jgi:hypothetical protein
VNASVQDEPGAAHSIVVRQSRAQRDGLFAGLVAVFALAFARGYPGAQTPGGRVAVAVFIGVVIVVLAAGWVRLVRRGTHLELSAQAIALVEAGSQVAVLTRDSRDSGDELRLVSVGRGRYRSWGLTSAGASTVITLPFFSRREVSRQCEAAGWRFGSA